MPVPGRLPNRRGLPTVAVAACLLAAGLLAAAPIPASAASQADVDDPTLLLRQPSVAGGQVAFSYAGDLWIAGLDGADPRRLTVHAGVERDPQLSPDGQWLAFTGEYDGNVDVYVMPVRGGQPTRLTYHPYPDTVRGWTPDGAAVVFRSTRLSTHHHRSGQLFTVPLAGGLPTALPMPHAERGAISPDGTRVAYTPFRDAFTTWKRYRGGRTTPIWIFDLETHETVEIPRPEASDSSPVWLGRTVYFLSDRAGTMNVFAYGPDREVRQLTSHDDLDVRALAADPGTSDGGVLVYEQAGRLHRLDPVSGESAPLPIRVAPDLPATRPHLEDVADQIRWIELSPSGVRAAFEARGDVFTVPAEHGDARNLTRTSGVHERNPAWSPDGQRIAYLSDESGEYQLVIVPQDGRGPAETIPLGAPGFYHAPLWSPDGGKIAYHDKALNLWWIDLEHRRPLLVDTEPYDHPPRSFDPVWSPDGRWLAYTRRLDNHLRALFVYDTATGQRHQLTDGMSDAVDPAFSRDGALLYFAASTDVALRTGWLDMTSYERPLRRTLYAIVLAADAPSPLSPRSDEEPAAGDDDAIAGKGGGKGDDDADDDALPAVTIDLDGIDRRVVALPVDAADLSSLETEAGGRLLYLRHAAPGQAGGDGGAALFAWDPEEREATELATGVRAFTASADGSHLLLLQTGDAYRIVAGDADADAISGADPLDLGGLQAWVDPRAEWAQIYDEAWRITRDYFYDPGMHGIDWAAMGERYRPWIAHAGDRSDVDHVLGELIGELVVGHAYRWGGDHADVPSRDVGLLGVDLVADGAFYRIARIYDGLAWNPQLRAPLGGPGVDVRVGDVILDVDGEPLRVPDNPYRLLQGKAGRQLELRVNERPSDRGARTVTVLPVASEAGLRHRAWVEGNRARVDEATGGRVAYVYVPNTAWDGYTSFNRYYYAQLDREALIVDERYNGGGSVADYMIDLLGREVLAYNVTREGADYPSPLAVIPGPKAMLINQDAGSGGDCLPHYFRLKGLGPLIGTRTWGGLIGIYDYPALIDGGVVTAPRIAFYGHDGRWIAENVGVAPDVEVEMTPAAVLDGIDPQLDKAIELILAELEADDGTPPMRPVFPDYSKK